MTDLTKEGEDYWRGYKAGLADQSGSDVLQAVLDAITGTLDTSTEIADHPNVKFAQMQRLELLKAAQGSAPEAGNPRIMELIAAASQASAYLADREDPSECDLRDRLWNAVEAVTQADAQVAQATRNR